MTSPGVWKPVCNECFQKLRMLRPENHFWTLPITKMTIPGVFPINKQFIKLYKSCKFMSTGLWKVGRHIVRRLEVAFNTKYNVDLTCDILLFVGGRGNRDDDAWWWHLMMMLDDDTWWWRLMMTLNNDAWLWCLMTLDDSFSLMIMIRRILKLVNIWTKIKLPRRFSSISLPRQFNSLFQIMSNKSRSQTTTTKVAFETENDAISSTPLPMRFTDTIHIWF